MLEVNRALWLFLLLLAGCDLDKSDPPVPADQVEQKVFETQDLRIAIDRYHDKPGHGSEVKVAAAFSDVDKRIEALRADLPNIPDYDKPRTENYITDLKNSRDLQWGRYLAIAGKSSSPAIAGKSPSSVAEPVAKHHAEHEKPELIAEHTVKKHRKPPENGSNPQNERPSGWNLFGLKIHFPH